ncbi:NUDIX hydrolase domain-like protein [Suillus clintonianus]|uniref:NUDIX hydrolase domain-like protein n=1 Tax=Suillus clintonianus TaxID=1904413 RepID=UPI001B86ADD3|nr:NUDIX hydrolase domain-like protein [Suillus clintonianus]KAG2116778.1 NUDIX hydrolase domain-like protein [Suillus clintonianus]
MPADESTCTSAPRPSYVHTFSRPTIELFEAALPTLKEESRQCIENLLRYRAPRPQIKFPRSQSAAVLVPLFIGRAGDLYVLLSRRSASLRQYAGDTALPGGKVDPEDITIEDTARREAFEEIGLAPDRERVPLLCVMEPYLAGNKMVVTPVVVLILDKTMQPNLNESEVTSIFSQPLASFLASSFPFPPNRVADPSTPYHTTMELAWSGGGTIRIHRFLTGRETDGVKPVFGLTAGILIYVAAWGYGRAPDFEYQSPNAPTQAQQIASALLAPSNPLRLACEREAIDANMMASFVLHTPKESNSEPGIIEWDRIGQDWRGLTEGLISKHVDVIKEEMHTDAHERQDMHKERRERHREVDEGVKSGESEAAGRRTGLNVRKEGNAKL